MGALVVAGAAWAAYSALNERAKQRRREVVEDALSYDPENIFGGAAFQDDRVLAAARAFHKGPINAGYSQQSRRPFYYNPKPGQLKPIIVFGSMGSLKTTSQHIPFALQWPGSLIVIEATGETLITSAHYRQRRFGPVSLVNPMRAYQQFLRGLPERRCNPMAKMNPLDLNTFGLKASKLTMGLITDDNSRDKFWDNSSRGLTKTVLMCESSLMGKRATLGRVADIIYQDPIDYLKWAYQRVWQPKLKFRARRWGSASLDTKSVNEVIQNTQTHLDFLMEQPIADCLSADEIDITSLKRRPQTIGFINPLNSIGVFDRFRTLTLEWILSELQTEEPGNVPVAILIDELAQYGRMESVALAMSSLRKFNCFMNIAVNDLGTLQSIYGREAADTFINNAGLIQFMSARDLVGSEYLSRILGETEVHGFSKNISFPASGNYQEPSTEDLQKLSVTYSRSQTKRSLALPHEIRNFGPREGIVFMDGVPGPIRADRKPYFETHLRSLARPNPYYRRGK